MVKSERKPGARGRPRSAEARTAIIEATRELLDEVGYTRLTITAIADRARAGRATVYRWWATKGDLVLEAARDHIDIGVVPELGTTEAELRAAIEQLIATFSDRLAAIVIFAAISTADHDPSMARELRARHIYPWRQSAAAAIERGIARGDLPADTDPVFILDLIVGMVFQRAVVVRDEDLGNLAERLLSVVLGGSAPGPL